MRYVAQVFLGYFVLLVMASLWRLGPAPSVAPELAALIGAYLGVTARSKVAPAVLCAAIVGYLADLLLATPPGLQATTAASVCVVSYLVHRRMLVRGIALTFFFSIFTGVVATLVGLLLRTYFDLTPVQSAGLWALFITVVLTGLAGPIVFRLATSVDRRFMRLPHLQSPAFD